MKSIKVKRLGRKMRPVYQNGGFNYLGNFAGTLLNADAMEEDGTVDVTKQGIGTALQYGAAGSTLGPVGAVIGLGAGAIVGGVTATKQNERAKRAKELEMLNRDQMEAQRSRNILSHYDEEGTNVNKAYYKNGGIKMYKCGGIKRYAMGGVQYPLASDVTIVDGRTHSQGGVHIGGVEVEDDEVGYEVPGATVWFSDKLKTDDGKTFAEAAEKIGKMKGKAEEKLKGDRYQRGAGEREVQKAEMRLNRLVGEQVKKQVAKGINPFGEYGQNGIIDPRFPFIPGEPLDAATDDTMLTPDNMLPQPPPYDYDNQPGNITQGGAVLSAARNLFENIADARKDRKDTRDARLYNRNKAFDTNEDGTLDEAEMQARRDQIQKRIGASLSRFGENAAPFIDNAVNAILTSRTPRPSVPEAQRAVPLKTDYDISAPLAEIRRSVRTTGEGLKRSTVNSAQYRNQLMATSAAGMEAANNLYTQKTNVETQLENQSRQNIQNIANANVGARNMYQQQKYEREVGIQGRVSANVANFVDDIRVNQQQANQKRMDLATIALMEKRFKETGVYDRTMEGYVGRLLNGENTDEVLSEMTNYLKQFDKDKGKDKDADTTKTQ